MDKHRRPDMVLDREGEFLSLEDTLAERRADTFFNRKIVIVSTPTVKGRSRIYEAYQSGSAEEWRLQCPSCGEYHFIEFADISVDKTEIPNGRYKDYEINSIYWACPSCGAAHTEHEMKRQPGKMVATNPEALEKGIRSFRLNAWVSPWKSWESIALEFLRAGKDPLKLQVVYNTLFGEPWEDRGELDDKATLLTRR